VVQVLIELGKADTLLGDGHGDTVLTASSVNGHERPVQDLLKDNSIEANSQNQLMETPFLCVSRAGHENIVRLLFDANELDMNLKSSLGWHPLFAASVRNGESIVRLLLQYGRARDIEMSTDNWANILERAINNGHASVVREIFENYKHKVIIDQYGVSLLSKGYYPLAISAERGDVKMTTFLREEVSWTPTKGMSMDWPLSM
jgi:ankyrin repeat protein